MVLTALAKLKLIGDILTFPENNKAS